VNSSRIPAAVLGTENCPVSDRDRPTLDPIYTIFVKRATTSVAEVYGKIPLIMTVRSRLRRFPLILITTPLKAFKSARYSLSTENITRSCYPQRLLDRASNTISVARPREQRLKIRERKKFSKCETITLSLISRNSNWRREEGTYGPPLSPPHIRLIRRHFLILIYASDMSS
jgi:hypothetical protein